MHAPTSLPLLRRVGRALAYVVFQLALLVAYALRRVGVLQLPLRFGTAAEAEAIRRRIGQPVRPRFSTRTAA